MKFGCFGFIRHIPLIEQAGYDTAELDICEINALSDDAFKRLLDRTSASSLSFEVFSGLIPLTERFHSEGFSKSRWLGQPYLPFRSPAGAFWRGQVQKYPGTL